MPEKYGNGSGKLFLIAIIAISIAMVLLFVLPIGGGMLHMRESAISFLLRKPPRFVSMEILINDKTRVIMAGESIEVTGNETLTIRNINANTFFKNYLSADIEGFGKSNELNETISTSEIRKQLMSAGIRSIPIDIYYISHVIAKVPIVIEVSEQDFISQLEAASNINEKVSILKNAFNTFPSDSRFLKELEELLMQRGDIPGLIDTYNKVLKEEADNEIMLGKLTSLYIKAGMLDEAQKLNSDIVRRNAQRPSTYLRLAMVAEAKSDINAKISYLQDGLLLDRGNSELLLELGKAYEAKGDKPKAMEIYKSISQDTSNKEVLITLIQDAVNRKDYDTAEPLLKRYIALFPDDKNAIALLGKIMGQMGDSGSQVEYYKKALALSPNDTVVIYNLGAAYEKAGNDKEALNAYRALLKLKPADKDALQRLASIEKKQGRYSEAYKHYSSLASIKPSRDNLAGVIEASVGLNDNQKTIDACEKYLKRYKDFDVALLLAKTHERVANTKRGKVRAKYLKDAIDGYIFANDIKQTAQVEQKIIDLSKERRRLLRDLR